MITPRSKDENNYYDKHTGEERLLASELLRPKNLEMGLNITFSPDKNRLFYSLHFGETWVALINASSVSSSHQMTTPSDLKF